MRTFIRNIAAKYFDRQLEFRVRLFNVMAMAGMLISLIVTASCLALGGGMPTAMTALATGIIAFALLRFATGSGKYQLCYMLTIVIIFLIFLPIIFFQGGGYLSSTPLYFIFAIVFTVFMLDGRRAVLMASLELMAYVGLIFCAYLRPEMVTPLADELTMVIDIIIGLCAVSCVLSATMLLLFGLYNRQQKRLDEQNHRLSQQGRLKTELLANISHEMKTPLTVVSVHIQLAEVLLSMGREGDGEKIKESFTLAKDELMRMSRLVDSSLRLSSLQEVRDELSSLDICDIIKTTSEAYRTLLEKNGNSLVVCAPDELPPIFGSADGLVQALSNLLSNANRHTRGGEISVYASAAEGSLSVSVSDTGEGVAPEILGRVFERGVSGHGGSGLGLTICRQIIREHGGDISIASTPGAGTAVTFTIPVHR